MKLRDSYPTKRSTSSSPDRKYGNDSCYQVFGSKLHMSASNGQWLTNHIMWWNI